MSLNFNTTYITISTPTSWNPTSSARFFGMSSSFIITILVSMVVILCVLVFTLLICHYKLKHQVSKLKQFNAIDNATIFHQIARRPSAPSSLNNKPRSVSRDVSHSYNFHKEKTQSLDDQTISDHHLTINRLYNPKLQSNTNHKLSLEIENIPRCNNQIKTSDSLLSYMGLSKQSHKLIPTFKQNTDEKEVFPFLIKQTTNSPTDKLLINKIQMTNINEKHNNLNVPNHQNPKTTNTETFSSNTRSGHSYLNTNGGYDTLKYVTTGNIPNSGEQSINSCSSSCTSSYTSSCSGSSVASPSTSMYTKSSEKGEKFEDEEISNDYKVHLKIIEDINQDDKENINMNRSNSLSFSKKKNTKKRIFNKNRMTMTDIDNIYNESSQTKLSSQLYETSKSNGTM
eukprot:412362_1